MISDWKYYPLAETSSEITNGITETQIDNVTGYPVTRIETISNEVIDPSRVKYLQNLSKGEIEKYRLKEGDVLFSHINSIGHIGKTAIYESNPDMLIHGMNLLKIRPDRSMIIPEFLYAYSKYHVFRNRVKALAKKAINQASINQKEVGSIYIPVPPLVEQQGIAEVLGSVDEAMRIQERVIAKTESLKHGLMQQLLTKGIGHTEYKQTPLGKIPKTWTISNLDNIVSIIDCKHYTPEYVDEGIPIIRTNDIQPEYLTFEKANRVSEESYKELISRHVPCKGDIVYSREGSFGIASLAVSDEPFCIGQRVVIIHPKKIDSKYLFFTLNSHKVFTQVLRNSLGTTVRRINVKDIKSLKILKPPLDEQIKITSILHSMEIELKTKIEITTSLNRLKRGLMQVLLSGEVRVEFINQELRRINPPSL